MSNIRNITPNSARGLYVIETLEAVSGKGPQLREKLLDMVPPSRKEKGCISYDLFSDRNNPERFTIIMHWVDREAYDAHNQSPHIDQFVQDFGDKLYLNSKIVEDLYDRLA